MQGNFYIIYLVYLLQFLRISSRVTLHGRNCGAVSSGLDPEKEEVQIPGAIEWPAGA
ncbi:MAG: hypothetical protein ACLRIL_08480 [Fusicatenibacter saccharivorans]